MAEIFKNFRVDNKWALAAAIAIVFGWLAAEVVKRVAPGDRTGLVTRVMRMIFVVLLVAVVMVYLPELLVALKHLLPQAAGEGITIKGEVYALGAPVSLSDATVTFNAEVPECQEPIQVGTDNTYSIHCAKMPPGRFTVTIKKPGYPKIPALITPGGTNQATLTSGPESPQ